MKSKYDPRKPRSEQLTRLLARYKVDNIMDLLRAIKKEYREETGAHLNYAEVDVILDQMLEAEYQRIAGGAYDTQGEHA
jgi:hypothetical protein